MDDLISRQAAIELIENESRKWGDEYGISDVLCDLADLPSAQPERKKGKWIRIIDEVFADRFECSECGKLPPIENFEWWLSDYCPNCGAYMKGETNEHL